MLRWLWAGVGLIALTLGAIGVIVPLLPTVPFLLLAGFCFARSSDRLHNWLLAHPLFGPPIADWNRAGAINRKAKRLATGSMVMVFAISLVLGLRPLILGLQATTLCCVALFIWTRPEA